MVRELNAEYGCIEYVAGRKRDPNGETNGKSNNLNHCLKNAIYKDYWPVNQNGPKIPKVLGGGFGGSCKGAARGLQGGRVLAMPGWVKAGWRADLRQSGGASRMR
jgi:hypothetical protein